MPEVRSSIIPDDLASCESTELRWIDTTSAIWLGSAQIATTSSLSNPAMKFYKSEDFLTLKGKLLCSQNVFELRGILLAQRHAKATALAQWKSDFSTADCAKYVRSVSTRAQWLQLQRDLMVVGFPQTHPESWRSFEASSPELGSRTWRGSRFLPYSLDVAVPIAEG